MTESDETTPHDFIEFYQAENGGYGWRRKAANGEIVEIAGETFKTVKGARGSANRNAPQVTDHRDLF